MAAGSNFTSTAATNCESSFGPATYTCNGRFDFSLLFEQSILAIGPSAVLLLAAPFRIQQLRSYSRKVMLQHPLMFLKLGACGVFFALQLALLILWTRTPMATKASVAAAVLGLLCAVVLGGLSYAEHTRSLRPSTLISLFLAFSILFDAVQVRTLWLLDDAKTLAALSTVALANKTTMFLMEIQGKRSFLLEAWSKGSPEATSGIINRGFFWWVNGLLVRGFKGSLNMAGLYETDEELRSRRLLHQMLAAWQKRRGAGKYALLSTLFDANKGTLLTGVFPRLCLMGFKFSQPFLIHRIISYVEGNKGPDPNNVGYGLIAATGLVYLGTAVSIYCSVFMSLKLRFCANIYLSAGLYRLLSAPALQVHHSRSRLLGFSNP
jgi:ATP-binding cassette, subfamily C (CFTR/MRP), member 1